MSMQNTKVEQYIKYHIKRMVGQEGFELSTTRPPAEYHFGNVPNCKMGKIYQARLLPQILRL